MAATRHVRRKAKERKSEGNVRQAGGPAAPSRVLDRLRGRLNHELNGRKDRATMAIDDVAETVRRVGEPLHRSSYVAAGGEYTEAAAARLHEWAAALRDRDVNELAAALGDLARRRPAVFVGAGFAAGVLAARFAKAGRD